MRVGVIGAGVMGSNHARVLAGLPDVVLVGIVDPLPEHRARAIELVGCRAFANLDALLAEGVDAVTNAAPTHLHHEVALACIARSIHILVEKPIAPTVEEGRDIVDAAQRAGVTLMVGHVERFNPAVVAIKQAISSEDILSIGITRVGPFPPRMSNVGVVIDLAVHDIDLIRWFTESDIVEVQPQLSSAIAEREDIALLQFRTASGVLAHRQHGHGLGHENCSHTVPQTAALLSSTRSNTEEPDFCPGQFPAHPHQQARLANERGQQLSRASDHLQRRAG